MKKIFPLFLIYILLISGISTVLALDHALQPNEYEILNNNYDMVIIAPLTFKKEIQPLIEHKNKIGVKTYLKTVEDIYQEYQGRDNAEQVKYFIKDALESFNIKYVLLLGGMKGQFFSWHVPVRYSQLNDRSGFNEFLSDLYFADIYKNNGTEFDDWDSNGNDIFAEWIGLNKDVLDLKPDVCVGRLPCRNRFEVINIVEKIIEYENHQNNQWFSTMVVVGSDTFLNAGGPEGEEVCDIASEYLENFQITKLYVSTGTLYSSDNVIDSLNKGCGFFLTHGRGGTDRVRMNAADGTEFIALHNKDVATLSNKGMYPVCILGECIHGKFDVSILNYLKINQDNWYQPDCIFECLGWRLIRSINGGAIATITNTNICYGTPGDNNNNGITDDAESYVGWLCIEFFRLYGEEGKRVLGEIHSSTITNYVETFNAMNNLIDCKIAQEWTLLGDPSLTLKDSS